jgi:hypothetical protein
MWMTLRYVAPVAEWSLTRFPGYGLGFDHAAATAVV